MPKAANSCFRVTLIIHCPRSKPSFVRERTKNKGFTGISILHFFDYLTIRCPKVQKLSIWCPLVQLEVFRT
jgi:hypothetical protein